MPYVAKAVRIYYSRHTRKERRALQTLNYYLFCAIYCVLQDVFQVKLNYCAKKEYQVRSSAG